MFEKKLKHLKYNIISEVMVLQIITTTIPLRLPCWYGIHSHQA